MMLSYYPGKLGKVNPTQADCEALFERIQHVLASISIRSGVLDGICKTDPKVAYSALAPLLLNLESTLQIAMDTQ